jgi:hypothetical protein
MMFFREYFRVLVPLTLLYAIYQLLLVPFLEPPRSKQPATKWDTAAIPQKANWWESHFPDGAWQRTSPRIVKTDNAILLFQSREEKSAKCWSFKPLTIIIPQRNSGLSTSAIIIQNPSGAEIEFKSPVEWSKELPPIERGRLLGEISIDSQADPRQKKERLNIVARDLIIDRRTISTLQPIQMTLGNSRVHGRDLTIQLDKDILTSDQPGNKNDSPFNGLDALELVYVDRVEIALENGGLWPSKDVPDAMRRRAFATLKCGGSFEFLFHQSKALLKDGVHMEHLVEGLQPDTFDCHELHLQVGWSPVPSPTTGNAAPSKPTASTWKVDRLEAFGNEGTDSQGRPRWLRLFAPGMNAEAHGQHLVMDFAMGSVSLSNRLPHTAPRENPNVYLKREGIQVWSSEVSYLNVESASSVGTSSRAATAASAPPRLGALFAARGMAQMDTKTESWKLSWSKQLQIRPQEDKDLVIVEGSANVYSPTHGRFMAEDMYLWLTPTTADMASKLAADFPDGNVPQFLPACMKAEGDVNVKSPLLTARVDDLQLWFSYPALSRPSSNREPHAVAPLATISNTKTNEESKPLPTPPPNALLVTVPTVPIQSSELTLVSPIGPPPAPVLQPAQSARVGTNATTSPSTQTTPFNVSGKTLQAKVVSDTSQRYIQDLSLDGNFRLTKEVASDSTPWPFEATGKSLLLSQTQPDATDITIVGDPDAKVKLGSGWVQARELSLRQGKNEFWINHPGEVVIPLEAMQTKSQAKPNSLISVSDANSFLPAQPGRSVNKASSIVWRELPRIRWGEAMTFDGRIARFGGGVAIKCLVEADASTLWHIECHANHMIVDMEEPLVMRSETQRGVANRSQVSTIKLEGNVDVQLVQTDHQNNRISMERMILPQMEFNVPKQVLVGAGPGQLWSRRLAASNPLQIAPVAKSGNNQNTTDLQCVHMSFGGRMEGVFENRTVTFLDRVEALMGAIASWNDEVNVYRVDRLGRNQTLLISDQLSIFDGSALSWNQNSGSRGRSSWELQAKGRAKMESNTDSGEVSVQADSLKYSAANDVVRIDGLPRQPAIISRVADRQSAPVELVLNTASIRLKTGEIDGMQIERFGGPLPSNLQPPGPIPANPSPSRPANAPATGGTSILGNPRILPSGGSRP